MTYTTPSGLSGDGVLVGVGARSEPDTPDEMSEPAGTPT